MQISQALTHSCSSRSAVVDLTPIVVSCFVLAMLSLMGGLLLLLLDTRLSSRLILQRF